MFCKWCGQDLGNMKVAFCPECGGKQEDSMPSGSVQGSNTQVPPMNNGFSGMPINTMQNPMQQTSSQSAVYKKPKLLGKVLFIAGAAVLLLVIIGSIGGKADNTSKKTGKNTAGNSGEIDSESEGVADGEVLAEKTTLQNNIDVGQNNISYDTGIRFVQGVQIDDSYQIYDRQYPTEKLAKKHLDNGYTGIEFISHDINNRDDDGDYTDVMLIHKYYEHPDGFFKIMLETEEYYSYISSINQWMYLDSPVNCDNCYCSFDGMKQTCWQLTESDTDDLVYHFREDDMDYSYSVAKAYLKFEEFPDTYIKQSGYYPSFEPVIRGNFVKAGKVILLVDDQIYSQDVYVGFDESMSISGGDWTYWTYNGSFSFPILYWNDKWNDGYYDELFGFDYSIGQYSINPILISEDEYQKAINNKTFIISQGANSSDEGTEEVVGAVPGGVEDFEGWWDTTYYTQLGSDVIKEGDVYIYSVSSRWDAGFYWNETKYYGKYDKNKKAVFFYKYETIDTEYDYDTGGYVEVSHDEEKCSGYMYTYGDGVLYVVENESEYNPNHEVIVGYR